MNLHLNLKRAFLFGVSLWLVIFALGFVTMPISYTVMEILCVIATPIVAFLLARCYFKEKVEIKEGIELGLCWIGISLIMDAIVLALLFGMGIKYFMQPFVWLGYALIVVGCYASASIKIKR